MFRQHRLVARAVERTAVAPLCERGGAPRGAGPSSPPGGLSPRAREKIERVVKEETGGGGKPKAKRGGRRDGKAKRRGGRETEVIDLGDNR